MKLSKFVVLIFFVLCISCGKKDASEILAEYRLINNFSKKLKIKTGLVLYCYGINNYLPKDYQFKNGVASFDADYALFKTQKDSISLEEARCLLVSVAEGLLQEINASAEVQPHLDVYPFTSDLIRVCIYFQDENCIDLGTGISTVFFSNGKIKYERYEIYEYRSKYPAIGRDFLVHEEAYSEALDIVKKQGCMINVSL